MALVKFNIETTSQKVTTEVKAGAHTFFIDEPKNLGGNDKGANPLNTLLGSLAGCENAIANIVAKEMKFNLNGIDFKIQGTLDPRGLMGDASVKQYFETITIEAVVDTDESNERIQELKEKTDSRCPVFNILKDTNFIKIQSTWRKK
ncbi:OsmC family protein [Fictibacillus nanhaiensis]|jgi:putative redox protein|uniref:OsmC family protein n=1 Tax=Fictibacillus nanhaiensis TaxID=742169 RepID=UPI00203C2346|nr:OsmC family protein [Fictibacillus nanhaiensis]MCM3731208.1 OsmC family protein [Fictibacillus nanhaiensis]